MKRQLTAMLVTAAVLVPTVGLHGASEAADERRVIIEIRGSKFVPAQAAVRSGDIVVWRNQDIAPHTATAQDASWDSEMIPAGGELEMVVSGQTVSAYYCVFHPSMVAALDVSTQ